MLAGQRVALPLVVAGAFALALRIAHAAPGDLDSSFGTGGIVTTAIGVDSVAKAVAVQPDGRIVVAGFSLVSLNGSDYEIVLTRYTPDGALDSTFGTGGTVATRIGLASGADAAALQPDGKIVVSGWSFSGGGSFVLVRYYPDGALDPTFGTGGTVTTPIALTGAGGALTLQPDGKIVVAQYRPGGIGGNFEVVLARYTPDGAVDLTFGSGGMVTTPIAIIGGANTLALQPDGKIVVVGHSTFSLSEFAVARYNPDGMLDLTFGSGGTVTTPIGLDAGANAVAVQPDRKIVVAGFSDNGSDANLTLVRYNPDGSLDAAFGEGGSVTTAIGLESGANAVAVQPDGKIVVAGFSDNGIDEDFALARYNSDGSLDDTFAARGRVTTAIGSDTDDWASAIALQPDGKIIAAGTSLSTTGYREVALVRYSGDQSLLPQPPTTQSPPQPPPASPAAPTPSVAITSPRTGRVARKALHDFAGTAGPSGQVATVAVALQKVDRSLLGHERCRWLKNNKARFVTARGGGCTTPQFLTAAGAEFWDYRLARALSPGTYELYVRVTLKGGQVHTTYTASQGNYMRFVVR